MDDSSATLDPTTLASETTQEQPAEKANLPTDATASTIEPLTSETSTLAEACKLAEVGETRRQFTDRFLQLIHESEFEYGFSTPADEYVREALNEYRTFAKDWISDLFLKNYSDPFITCAILRVIAHFDYQQMYPQGMIMAIACAPHKNTDVRECCVRCFESWGAPETLSILRSISFSKDWLDEYLKGVISDLERLTNHVVSR